MVEKNLAGKNAIVTGGSRGIGRGIATSLAARGANVAFCHYNDDAKAAQTVSELEDHGVKSYAASCDVSAVDEIRSFYQAVVNELGQIDILVNNAGHNITENFEDISEKSFDRMISVHQKGTFFMTQAVYKDMKRRGEGRIINVTSQLAYKEHEHYS